MGDPKSNAFDVHPDQIRQWKNLLPERAKSEVEGGLQVTRTLDLFYKILVPRVQPPLVRTVQRTSGRPKALDRRNLTALRILTIH